MTALLTQCPHCQTSFRVSNAQLNAAHGLVRCGSCLGVFSASANEIRIRAPDGYLVEEIPHDEAPQDSDQSFSDSDNEEAPSLADNDDADELIPVTSAADAIEAEPAQTPVDEPAITAAPPPSKSPLSEPSTPPVNAAMPIVVQTEDSALTSRETRIHTERDETELWNDGQEPDIQLGDLQLDEWLNEDDAEEELAVAAPTNKAMAPDDVVRDTVEDRTSEVAAAVDTTDDEDLTSVDDVVEDESRPFEPEIAHAVEAVATVPLVNDKRGLHAALSTLADDELDPLGDDQLDALEELPVTITSNDRLGSRLAQAGLLLLNILLLLALPLPWLYAERDTLATHPRYAFLAPAVCRLFTCTPPAATFANAIYSQQLLVRSHPRYADALEVSFIFHNDTTLPQPFPRVELAFSSFTSELLANRLFTPQEYLPTELRQLDAMPAKSSVQVVLELADPGKEAVNYTVKLHPPAP